MILKNLKNNMRKFTHPDITKLRNKKEPFSQSPEALLERHRTKLTGELGVSKKDSHGLLGGNLQDVHMRDKDEKIKTMTKTQISKKRHIAKTLTWRVIGTIDTMLLGWLVSGDPMIGIQVGALELFTKMILYYFHERAWYRSKFGIKK